MINTLSTMAQSILDSRQALSPEAGTFRDFLESVSKSGESSLYAIIAEEASETLKILAKLEAGETKLTAREREDLKYSVIALRQEATQLGETAVEMKSDLDRDIPLWNKEQKAEIKRDLPAVREDASDLETINTKLGELCRTLGITLPDLPAH